MCVAVKEDDARTVLAAHEGGPVQWGESCLRTIHIFLISLWESTPCCACAMTSRFLFRLDRFLMLPLQPARTQTCDINLFYNQSHIFASVTQPPGTTVAALYLPVVVPAYHNSNLTVSSGNRPFQMPGRSRFCLGQIRNPTCPANSPHQLMVPLIHFPSANDAI